MGRCGWWVSGTGLSDRYHDGGILRTLRSLSSPGYRTSWRQGPSGKLSGPVWERLKDGYWCQGNKTLVFVPLGRCSRWRCVSRVASETDRLNTILRVLARIVRQPSKNCGSKNHVAVGSGVIGADETVCHPWTGQARVGTRTRWNKRK